MVEFTIDRKIGDAKKVYKIKCTFFYIDILCRYTTQGGRVYVSTPNRVLLDFI